MVWVKICGIREAKHAQIAFEAGANAIGLVFAPSKRQVTLPEAQAICRKLPAALLKVGVFVNEGPERVRQIFKACPLDLVQLHGDEDLAYAQALQLPYIKALRLHSMADLDSLAFFQKAPVLVDSTSPGSGTCVNWDLVQKAVGLHKKIILAGGLNPENIQSALSQVKSYGVDVSSGVESQGRKDADKIRSFVFLSQSYSNL